MLESANKLYRESGSTLSFKDWLNEQKKEGKFIYNKQLNDKIKYMENKEYLFHQADGNTSTATTPTTTLSKGKGKYHDVKMMVIGSAITVAAILIICAIKKHK